MPSANGSFLNIAAGSGSNPNWGKDPSSVSPSPTSASAEPLSILIVEDNRADIHLILEALKAARLNTKIQVLKDGEEATNFFDALDRDDTLELPQLLILDINLPKKQGNEALAHIRRSRRGRNIAVIVVSTSVSERDREAFQSLNVNKFFRKPSEFREFLDLGDLVCSMFPPKSHLS